MKKIQSRFAIHPLRETYEEVSKWFTSPLGRRLLAHERKAISEELRYLFGYHFMQLSAVKSANFSPSSRINHCFSFAPSSSALSEGYSHIHGISEFDELPLEDDVIDVTVLHHVLEFSQNPHQVLKEAARVTIPRGYIIIVAFNPLSIAGMLQPLGALFSRDKGVSHRRALRASRMRDWLEFLDFSCVSTRHVFHNMPINNRRFLSSSRFLEKLSLGRKLPMGMSLVMVARKDKVGLTPIKPKWEKGGLLDAMPIPKRAMRANESKQCMVLPFKTKVKREF